MNWSKFWDVLAWIGFGNVVLYLILKSAGILNSPFSIDLIAIVSGSLYIGRHVQKIDYMEKKLDSVDKRLIIVEKNLRI